MSGFTNDFADQLSACAAHGPDERVVEEIAVGPMEHGLGSMNSGIRTASIAMRPEVRWRARYRDAAGKDHARLFDRKAEASGADVKTVQARLRRASAKMTHDTHERIAPHRDQSTRAAAEQAFQDRADSLRD